MDRRRTSNRSPIWIASRPSPTHQPTAGSTPRWTAVSSAAASEVSPQASRPSGRWRSACCAARPPTASRSRRPILRSLSRLAPAAPLGHQRGARSSRHTRAVPRASPPGTAPGLHPWRIRAAARTVGTHRRFARASIEAPACRGAPGRQPGQAEGQLRSDLRSRRPPAAGAGRRAGTHRARSCTTTSASRSRWSSRTCRRRPTSASALRVPPESRARAGQERARPVAPAAPGEAPAARLAGGAEQPAARARTARRDDCLHT